MNEFVTFLGLVLYLLLSIRLLKLYFREKSPGKLFASTVSVSLLLYYLLTALGVFISVLSYILLAPGVFLLFYF